MIAVFVGDKNGIQGFGRFPNRGEPGDCIFAAEAGIDEEARMLGTDKNRVSGTARRQYADLQIPSSFGATVPQQTSLKLFRPVLASFLYVRSFPSSHVAGACRFRRSG